jgi:hypothetical protein
VQGAGSYVRASEVIRVLYGNIRGEIAGDFIKPLVIEVVDIFQVLLAVHSLKTSLIKCLTRV